MGNRDSESRISGYGKFMAYALTGACLLFGSGCEKLSLVNNDPKSVDKFYETKRPALEDDKNKSGLIMLTSHGDEKYLIRLANEDEEAYSWSEKEVEKLKEEFSNKKIEILIKGRQNQSIKHSGSYNGKNVYTVPIHLIRFVEESGNSNNVELD